MHQLEEILSPHREGAWGLQAANPISKIKGVGQISLACLASPPDVGAPEWEGRSYRPVLTPAGPLACRPHPSRSEVTAAKGI